MAEDHRAPNILEVPLEADGEVVTFDLDNDLPENPSEICVLLENEKCAVEYWLAIGVCIWDFWHKARPLFQDQIANI